VEVRAVGGVVAVANELKNLIDKINIAVRDEKIKRVALTTVLAIQKPRIFEKGLDDNGAQIGTYGSNPISISKKNQARNTGKTYFKGGYAEYKSAIGKNQGYVNLRNTDQMMMDYGVIFNGSETGLGFQNPLNANKAGWMQEKYNKEMFFLSDKEVDVIGNVIVQQLNRLL
jgi:hypothetical protein